MFLLSACFALVIVVLCVHYVRHNIFYHFRTVDRGKLYRSGVLSSIGIRCCHKLYKFKTVVNLLSEKESKNNAAMQFERAYCERENISWLHLPMRQDTSPSNSQIDEILSVMKDPANHPVLVHCKQGVIRTSIFVALYLHFIKGVATSDVFGALHKFGHTFERRPEVRNFIQNIGL